MHHRFDDFSKNILRDALSRACSADTEVEVLAATQKIDVYTTPDPARAAERARMGLLGELAAQTCLATPGSRASPHRCWYISSSLVMSTRRTRRTT